MPRFLLLTLLSVGLLLSISLYFVFGGRDASAVDGSSPLACLQYTNNTVPNGNPICRKDADAILISFNNSTAAHVVFTKNGVPTVGSPVVSPPDTFFIGVSWDPNGTITFASFSKGTLERAPAINIAPPGATDLECTALGGLNSSAWYAIIPGHFPILLANNTAPTGSNDCHFTLTPKLNASFGSFASPVGSVSSPLVNPTDSVNLFVFPNGTAPFGNVTFQLVQVSNSNSLVYSSGPIALANGNPPIVGNSYASTPSITTNVTAAGQYCWDVIYSGDNTYSSAVYHGIDTPDRECFTLSAPSIVGGEILGVDMTSLFVAGAFANAWWIIPATILISGGILTTIITMRSFRGSIS